MESKLDIILDSLDQLEDVYTKAHEPGYNNLFVWLGLEFFVDQVRHIILPRALLDEAWQTNSEGSVFATNKPLLFMFEPDSRHLPISYFQKILAEMLQNTTETNLVPHRLGYFLTLMVAEVKYNPLALTTTLLTLVKAIEQKQLNENIFDLVPSLLIDAATTNLSEEELKAYKQANMAQQIRLMQEVRPNVVAEIDTLLSKYPMETTIDIIKKQILTYLQTQIFID